MNNKRLGNAFEQEMCRELAKRGYWVHFMSPDVSGAQPFDIIATKGGIALAADCKTCEDSIFRIGRLESNQLYAFDKWYACGNTEPLIFVKHKGIIYKIGYLELKTVGKVKLNASHRWQ